MILAKKFYIQYFSKEILCLVKHPWHNTFFQKHHWTKFIEQMKFLEIFNWLFFQYLGNYLRELIKNEEHITMFPWSCRCGLLNKVHGSERMSTKKHCQLFGNFPKNNLFGKENHSIKSGYSSNTGKYVS